MRISLDLDSTILRRADESAIDPSLPPFKRGDIEEFLRFGIQELIQGLIARECEIWIYTNSYRGRKDLMNWFQQCKLPITNVVNQQLHDLKRTELGKFAMWPRKSPHWFDIDLHIDDSIELERDAAVGGFKVLRICPDDVDWVAKIIFAVDALK